MFGVPYFQHQWIITFCARFGYAIKKNTEKLLRAHSSFAIWISFFFWLVVAAVIFNARRLYVMHLKCLTTYAAFQITFISDRVYLSTHIHPCYAHLYTIHVKFCQRIIICVGFVSYFSHFFSSIFTFRLHFIFGGIYLFIFDCICVCGCGCARKRANERPSNAYICLENFKVMVKK